MSKTKNIAMFASVSILAAITTLFLKFAAYFFTGSVGLLSDAIESVVNLLAASITMWMLYISAKPPDEDHAYGHTKAEYFASVMEGIFIIVAAFGIAYAATARLITPQDVESPWIGIVFSTVASSINAAAAIYLLKLSKEHRSLALEADAHHLLTDVYTSVGVVVGLIIVSITNIKIIDPIIALLVALNILITGFSLIKRSVTGFMDASLPKNELKKIHEVLSKYEKDGIIFHALRSRVSGMRTFASVHVLVPGSWSVQKGHDILEEIEQRVTAALPGLSFLTHLEPSDDEKSFRDID